MSNMAQWGSKKFLLSPTTIMLMEDFSTSVELKADSENDTSGTSPTNTRGLVARPVSFAVTYARAAGADPRAQLEEWESLVGQSNPLYIGGKRFGPPSLMLIKVESSNFVFSANGDFLSVTVLLSMLENTGGKTSSTSKSSTVQSSTTASTNKTASVYAETVEKRKAMDATASASDKNAKKPNLSLRNVREVAY